MVKSGLGTLRALPRLLWHPERAPDGAVCVTASDLPEDSPRTVFAGHHHVFKVSTVGGIRYYSLATTGGVSSLAGPAEGEFDHLVWVTITDEGPRIANLMQDGVWGDNPIAEVISEAELTTLIRQ